MTCCVTTSLLIFGIVIVMAQDIFQIILKIQKKVEGIFIEMRKM